MKGFIEVTGDNDTEKTLLRIEAIDFIGIGRDGRTYIKIQGELECTQESYEEIKTKIEEAQGE